MTIKEISTLKTDVNTVLADNTTGDITPSDVRSSVIDTIDSLNIYTQFYDETESGVNFGLTLTINGTSLDMALGQARFSAYDGTPATIVDYAAETIAVGDLSKDLSLVYAGWPVLSASDTVIFFVVAEDGNIYQTNTSPLSGEVVRKYLTIGAVQLDDATNRNISLEFPIVNTNAKEYERSNVATPQFTDAMSNKLSGNAGTTFSRLGGGVLFTGLNYASGSISKDIKEYLAQDPMPFLPLFRDGAGGHILGAAITDFAPYVGLIDDGTVATTLPNGTIASNKFTVHYAFFEASLGIEIIQIGTNSYNSIDEAVAAINNGSEALDIAPAILGTKNHCYIVMKGNASAFNDIAQVSFVKPSGSFFNRL